MSPGARGVSASLSASVLFAGMFYLSGIATVSAEILVAWRIFATLGLYGLALLYHAARRATRDYLRRIAERWWRVPLLFALACLITSQLWLFAWAPQHGHALDATLGFLLLPIALVLGGRFVLREPMSHAQWWAAGIAGAGVTLHFTLAPAISWVTFAICLGYPTYFIIRRMGRLDGPAGFGIEMTVVSPAAVVLVATNPGPVSPADSVMVALLSLCGAVAMFAYLAAARLLSLPVFGLLGYAEPVLLLVASILLGESLTTASAAVLVLLLAALAILVAHGVRSTSRGWPYPGRDRTRNAGSEERGPDPCMR